MHIEVVLHIAFILVNFAFISGAMSGIHRQSVLIERASSVTTWYKWNILKRIGCLICLALIERS